MDKFNYTFINNTCTIVRSADSNRLGSDPDSIQLKANFSDLGFYGEPSKNTFSITYNCKKISEKIFHASVDLSQST